MTRLCPGLIVAIAAFGLVAGLPTARAADTVTIGASRAVLLKPATPVASVILVPGGDGRIEPGANGHIGRLANNQLVRTRTAYEAKGLAVLVVDADVDLAQAVDFMAKIKRPVTVVGTSRGTLRIARGLAHGAKPDALVLTSGFLSDASGGQKNVINIMRSPANLPKTLVIHHRKDGCQLTRPAGVEPFLKWAGGKAKVAWLDGGASQGDPCQAKSHHGFLGLDGKVVALAAAFR